MLPSRTPTRVERAHASIVPIYEFLAKYERWVAAGGARSCDFALGNPQTMPPEGFVDALRTATVPKDPSWYAYKTNEAGSRRVIAESLIAVTGRRYPPENIFVTNGATGALLVTMNALIGPDDEVVFSTPPWFFYEGMILNSGGNPVLVPAEPETFDLDVDAIGRALSPRTRFVIVNSPNNPTGKVYEPGRIVLLAKVLERASAKIGRPIYLVSDESYRTIVYDGRAYHSPTTFYKNSIMIYTYGKTLLTPGQRLGYIALSPEMDDLEALRTVLYSSQILCGWAMASAVMHHSLRSLQGVSLDVADLQRRRDRLVSGLREAGYEVRVPEGAFYVTPKAPIADDVAFSDLLAEQGVFCLPGSVVHMQGYLRASITASTAMIERALPLFAEARRKVTDAAPSHVART